MIREYSEATHVVGPLPHPAPIRRAVGVALVVLGLAALVLGAGLGAGCSASTPTPHLVEHATARDLGPHLHGDVSWYPLAGGEVDWSPEAALAPDLYYAQPACAGAAYLPGARRLSVRLRSSGGNWLAPAASASQVALASRRDRVTGGCTDLAPPLQALAQEWRDTGVLQSPAVADESLLEIVVR